MRNPVNDLFEWNEMRWMLAGQFCKRMLDAKVHCEMHNPHIVTFNFSFGIATVSFNEDKIEVILAEYSGGGSQKPLYVAGEVDYSHPDTDSEICKAILEAEKWLRDQETKQIDLSAYSSLFKPAQPRAITH